MQTFSSRQQIISDTVFLKFLVVPILSLKLGSNLDAENIREGGDVYFECMIVSCIFFL